MAHSPEVNPREWRDPEQDGSHFNQPTSLDIMPKACKFCGEPRWALAYVVGSVGIAVLVIVCEVCDDPSA
jgi:hypothetical protein